MTTHEIFARQALSILEAHEDWSSDTTDEIAEIAYELGLAQTNPDTGLFQAIPED